MLGSNGPPVLSWLSRDWVLSPPLGAWYRFQMAPGIAVSYYTGALARCALRLASPDSLYYFSLFGFFAVSDNVTLVDVIPRPCIPLSGFLGSWMSHSVVAIASVAALSAFLSSSSWGYRLRSRVVSRALHLVGIYVPDED